MCDSFIHHKSLPSTASAETRRADGEHGKKQLVNAHAADCPWRVTHSPLSFCQLQPAPGQSLLLHAETASASVATLAQQLNATPFDIDPLFHEQIVPALKETVSASRAAKLPSSLRCLGSQLQALSQATPGDASAIVKAALSDAQPLLLAITGWAATSLPLATHGKRTRDDADSSSLQQCLLCATCQACVPLRVRPSPSDHNTASKQPRNNHSSNAGSLSFRDAALRAVQASNKAAASCGRTDVATPASHNAVTPSKGGGPVSTQASPQTSPLSSSLVQEFSPPGSAGAAVSSSAPCGMLHPLLAHRSSCPWVTPQTVQRQRSRADTTLPQAALVQRSVSEMGEVSLRAVETVAALSSGGRMPATAGAGCDAQQAQTVTKPGWQLYVDALCDSLLE